MEVCLSVGVCVCVLARLPVCCRHCSALPSVFTELQVLPDISGDINTQFSLL